MLKDTQLNELDQDLKRLKEQQEVVTFQLSENLIKKQKTEENSREIYLFYEKLLENAKNLQNYINRQNTVLEKGKEL